MKICRPGKLRLSPSSYATGWGYPQRIPLYLEPPLTAKSQTRAHPTTWRILAHLRRRHHARDSYGPNLSTISTGVFPFRPRTPPSTPVGRIGALPEPLRSFRRPPGAPALLPPPARTRRPAFQRKTSIDQRPFKFGGERRDFRRWSWKPGREVSFPRTPRGNFPTATYRDQLE